MSTATIPELDRLVALRSLNVLDTAPDEQFEAVCRTARRVFGIEHAFISLIDADRQWLASGCRLIPNEIPRVDSFCDVTIRDDDVLVVPDATQDRRFADLPLVSGSAHVRFYAGAPLILGPGTRVGALCLIDTAPRSFSQEDAAALRDLAAIVVGHLRLGEANARFGREVTAREHTTNLLHIALDSAKAGAWEWDMRTGVITLARESVDLYGLPSDDDCRLSTSDWTQLLRPDDREGTWENVRRAVETRTTYRAEYRVTRNGAERWLRASGRAFYDEQGRPYRMVGLHFDVTEHKTAEAALQTATAVADAARVEAEQANTAKSEFLAAMSHEIRTPLNSILGYAELLLDGDHHGEADRRYLELVQSSGFALLTVVNDILDFSKIEAGRLELDPTEFVLKDEIDNAVAIVAGTSLKRPLTISCELDPELPTLVTADEARLKQVLLNLLNNAVKFTLAGSVTLRVKNNGPRLQSNGAIADALRFEIIDTGIGIAPHQRARLFKQFSQVDGSISRRFGGSGLGLAICQRLVTMMGGEIGVESRLGAGSTFWFTMDMQRAEARSCAVSSAERDQNSDDGALVQPSDRDAIAVAPKRLLLVEDVLINQDLARAVLEARGYHVDVVSDGVAAVAAIQAKAVAGDLYDAVLMDVQMPAMDGLTATRRVRCLDEPAASVPIIAMTANVLPGQIADLHAAGMDDHVGKPFKRAELYEAIERWASRRSAAQQAERCRAA